MFVSDTPAGGSFKVKRVVLGKEVGKRLADMGFTEGVEGAVVRCGFFQGTYQIRIRGYDILIRRSEAAGIEVEPVGDWTALRDSRRKGFGFGSGCRDTAEEGSQGLGAPFRGSPGHGRKRGCGCGSEG